MVVRVLPLALQGHRSQGLVAVVAQMMLDLVLVLELALAAVAMVL
jgi:hypothetical protein